MCQRPYGWEQIEKTEQHLPGFLAPKESALQSLDLTQNHRERSSQHL